MAKMGIKMLTKVPTSPEPPQSHIQDNIKFSQIQAYTKVFGKIKNISSYKSFFLATVKFI